MKIFYFITKSNFGGAQKYLLALATRAKQAQHDVTVVCGGTGEAGAPTGLLATKLAAAGIKTHYLPSLQRNMSPFKDVRTFFALWWLLRKERPAVLHTSSSKAGGIGALAGRLAGIPRIIFTSHGLTIDEVWRPKWQRLLIYLGTWLTLRLSHHSIMINTETYHRAVAMPHMSNRVSLIKNGIEPIAFLDKTAARAKLAPHLPPDTLIIGGIGELHPNKNWHTAIIALLTLPPDVHFIIIGEGEERPALERLIAHHHLSQRVHLVGYLDAAATYLSAFDIFILPSIKEGLPYVLLEAGLAALPVIASDLAGNRDIIDTGENGLLVTPTTQLFSTTLEMLVRDAGMRRRLGSALQTTVTTTFSVEDMRQNTFSLYASSTLVA